MFAYYDLFYADKDYGAEAKYLAGFLRGKTLLDVGCGSGKHGGEFIKLGFEVSGIEREKELARLCPFPVVVGDVTQTSFERQFDSITACFHVVNYQTQDLAL